jgi:hypothetical protein
MQQKSDYEHRGSPSDLKADAADYKLILEDVRNLQDLVTTFQQIQVDVRELAYLKAIILFKTGKELAMFLIMFVCVP